MPKIFKLNFKLLNNDESLISEFIWTSFRQYFLIKNVNFKVEKYYFDDIISYKLNKSKSIIINDEEINVYFELLMYPLIKQKRCCTKAIIFGEQLNDFVSIFTEKLKPIKPPHLPKELKDKRRALVIINPFSGQKKALELYETHSKPLFKEANIETEICYTKYQNHAIELIQEVNIDRYEFIVVVSGDGLVNEVITGLLTRNDSKRALKMPILHIPGGTGNALASSIAFKASEPIPSRGIFCKEMTLMSMKPSYYDLRLHHFESEMDGHRCMFLSASWGLIADIDICSERFRWAGMIRLHIEAFLRIMQLPTVAKYRGKISYIPVDDDELIKKTKLRSDAARELFGKNYFSTGITKPIDDTLNETTVNQDNKPTIEQTFQNNHVVTVPSLKDPLPENWTTIEGEFVYATVSSLSHLGSDLPYMPVTKLEEDVLYLTIVDWKVVKNRFQVAAMFTIMDRGAHLDFSCFHVIPVKACRIEPAVDSGGYVALDGEPCAKGASFQVVSSNLCATVISRNPRD